MNTYSDYDSYLSSLSFLSSSSSRFSSPSTSAIRSPSPAERPCQAVDEELAGWHPPSGPFFLYRQIVHSIELSEWLAHDARFDDWYRPFRGDGIGDELFMLVEQVRLRANTCSDKMRPFAVYCAASVIKHYGVWHWVKRLEWRLGLTMYKRASRAYFELMASLEQRLRKLCNGEETTGVERMMVRWRERRCTARMRHQEPSYMVLQVWMNRDLLKQVLAWMDAEMDLYGYTFEKETEKVAARVREILSDEWLCPLYMRGHVCQTGACVEQCNWIDNLWEDVLKRKERLLSGLEQWEAHTSMWAARDRGSCAPML